MAKNSNLLAAKAARNDEFYTQREDVESELAHYKHHFRDKVVYCNCDNPKKSEFVKFFVRHFEEWGLKKLIATHYVRHEQTFLYTMEPNPVKGEKPIRTKKPLLCNGDFRTFVCVKLLTTADIVVTNPPFSLFRQHVKQLLRYKKKFLLIGNKNAINYKEIYPLIVTGDIRLGYNDTNLSDFDTPDGMTKKVQGLCRWFTNLDIKKNNPPIELTATYKGNESNYPVYDNLDAIECGKVSDIPKDFTGWIGVPITYMDKHCDSQFKIIGFGRGYDGEYLTFTRNGETLTPYSRIIIQRRDTSQTTCQKEPKSVHRSGKSTSRS